VAKTKMQRKIGKVMREYSHGTLHSGSKHGPKVTSPAQAKAIAMSESRKAAHKGRR
jgi:hypothetical protein